MATRQAGLEPLALSASGRERMIHGWAAASEDKRIVLSGAIARFGDILLRTRFIGVGAFFCERWGARGAKCLPRDVRRRSSQATSRFDGITTRRCLCVRTGFGIMEARPHPRALLPPRTAWAKVATRAYSVLQSKWPLPRVELVDPRERDGNDREASEQGRLIRCLSLSNNNL